MHASIVVSVTVLVIAVAACIAVFFALRGGEDAASYHYKVTFTTDYHHPDGTSYSNGEGTVVVNKGVQSFIYNDHTKGRDTINVQEESGLTYQSGEPGVFNCLGDLGGIDYTSATPAAVADSLVEDSHPECSSEENSYTVNLFDADFYICATAAGVPTTVRADNFVGTVTSFEVSKTTAFEGVKVPTTYAGGDVTVNTDFCESNTELSTCQIDGDYFPDGIEMDNFCCASANAWVQHFETDASLNDCQVFDSCFGGCSGMFQNLLDKATDANDDTGNADEMRSKYDSYCALFDKGTVADSCATSTDRRRTLLTSGEDWRLRDLKEGNKVEKIQANARMVSAEERASEKEALDLTMEEEALRVAAVNRRKLVAEHGEDFHRHLSAEDVERRLTTKIVCFMHGMGGHDIMWGDSGNDANEYWGEENLRKTVASVTDAKNIFYINTNSKYCDFTAGNSCTGAAAALVSGRVRESSPGDDGIGLQINTGLAAGARGSLPNQFKEFIDRNGCNTIIAHSMGNPTMATIYETCKNNPSSTCNKADYEWYNSAGPMRHSQAAGVVKEYCDLNMRWYDYFSFKGVADAALKLVVNGMGYCGTGTDAHRALHSLVPQDQGSHDAYTGVCGASFFGGGPDCRDDNGTPNNGVKQGSHWQRGSNVKSNWFKKKTGRQSNGRSCGKGCWHSWFTDLFKNVCEATCDNCCKDAGPLINDISTDGILGSACGTSGYGFGVKGMPFGPSGGNIQNMGLALIEKITDYGEKSDGMVSWSSCAVKGSFGTSSSNNNYKPSASHLDTTGYTGDGVSPNNAMVQWFKKRIQNNSVRRNLAEVDCATEYLENENCSKWVEGGHAGHPWVQAQCPCSAAA